MNTTATQTPTPKEETMTIIPIAATPTSLAGFSATCPTCGMTITHTMESGIVLDAQAHKAWHAKQGR